MGRRDAGRAAQPHAVMDAGVDQFVVHHQIVGAGQRREQSSVRRETGAEIECGFAAEMGGGLGLQRFVFVVMAAQQS